MYKVDCCPCCSSLRFETYPAIVSPFLASYALGCEPFSCSLLECKMCTFRFFDSRLTDEEVAKLYSGYRGVEYFKIRHKYEPWYSKAVNTGIGADPNEVKSRQRGVADFLSKQQIETNSLDTVLDYGGDRGQFIPEGLGRSRYVFELSDAVPDPGVVRLGSEEDLRRNRFDFVMLCGVLEHCSVPCEVLEKVRKLASNSQSLYFIAVPFERYSLRFAGRRGLYRRYLKALLQSKPLLTLADFWSTVGRMHCNLIPPLGLIKCHEHLNFFNERSMAALLQSAGFEVMACTLTSNVSYPVRAQSLYALARPR